MSDRVTIDWSDPHRYSCCRCESVSIRRCASSPGFSCVYCGWVPAVWDAKEDEWIREGHRKDIIVIPDGYCIRGPSNSSRVYHTTVCQAVEQMESVEYMRLDSDLINGRDLCVHCGDETDGVGTAKAGGQPGELSIAECHALRLLYHDGWDKGVLKMVFEISEGRILNHVNGDCGRHSELETESDDPPGTRTSVSGD